MKTNWMNSLSRPLVAAVAACLVCAAGHAQSQGEAPSTRPPETRTDLDGRIERVEVHGRSLEGNLSQDPATRAVSVYLPPGYDSDPNRRYPVIYVLHGFTDSDDRWFGLSGPHFVDLPRSVDLAYDAGANEAIIVMPNAFTKFHGSMYSSSATTGDWEAFVAEDLVAFIDGRYRTMPERASRGLAGHSMGGYGTLRIGMKYPDVFAALYSLSPCCMDANLQPDPEVMTSLADVRTADEIAAAGFFGQAMLASAAAWSPDPQRPPHYLRLPAADGKVVPDVVAAWAANAPLAMVHQYVPELAGFTAIAIDAGDEDQPIASTVEKLSAILTGYGIEHEAEIYPGDHLNRINERITTKMMPFFSEHLATR